MVTRVPTQDLRTDEPLTIARMDCRAEMLRTCPRTERTSWTRETTTVLRSATREVREPSALAVSVTLMTRPTTSPMRVKSWVRMPATSTFSDLPIAVISAVTPALFARVLTWAATALKAFTTAMMALLMLVTLPDATAVLRLSM